MTSYRWTFLTIPLVAFPAGAVAGQQDVSFLQILFDGSASGVEAHYETTFTDRYIDASSIQRAFTSAGLPVPAMDELRAALHRPDERQFVVDSLEVALERGPPDAPEFLGYRAQRLQAYAARGASPPDRTREPPDEVRWVRNDGLVFRVARIRPTGDDGYTVLTHVTHTGISGLGDRTFGGTYARRDGEWVRADFVWIPQ